MQNRFDKLIQYNNVFVTGCQRSGTEFVTRIVAKEANKTFLSERDYNVHDLDRLNELLNDTKTRAIHCPSLSVYLEFMVYTKVIKPNDCVIWVKRNKEDVYKSMKRIGWGGLTEEAKYYPYGEDSFVDIWDYKNNVWKKQKDKLSASDIFTLEVQYEDLKSNPLWKEPKDRR